jgi:hypothetical protein
VRWSSTANGYAASVVAGYNSCTRCRPGKGRPAAVFWYSRRSPGTGPTSSSSASGETPAAARYRRAVPSDSALIPTGATRPSAVQAIGQQDLPVIGGIVVLATAFVVPANLPADTIYAVLYSRARPH